MLSSVLLFLNIGTPEMILILFVALMLFGGNKLPELARGLGKGIRDFKEASEDVKREINNQINNYEDKKPEKPVETTPELPAHEPVAGTIAAYEGHAATDAIEEDEIAGEAIAENMETQAAAAEDATYENETELKHPVTGSANKLTSAPVETEQEPVNKTIE
ncbi:twin-arginine translocase TatA/TatE family subunit [Mucilaginibacter litoreus]|uniref:Sec-independent protein translocase protein TatA n=1 Tax=Mucilaginibacter litoreus TaxID=1048221 RepID=A0ABW3AUM0_9SPHI